MNARAARRLVALFPVLLAASGCADETKPPSPPAALPSVDDVMTALPQSCSFECGACVEPEERFQCPTIAPWSQVPHDAACGEWDGSYPAAARGQCSATLPTGEAA